MASGIVNIKVWTWSRDSHGLFDYDSRDVQTAIHKTRTKWMIISDNGEIKIQQSEIVPHGATVLVRLIQREGKFMLVSGGSWWNKRPKQTSYEKLWVVIKSIKGGKYKLSEGDLIRLGRVVYGVRKIGGEEYLADKWKPISVNAIQYGGCNTTATNWRSEVPHPVIIADGEEQGEDGELTSESSCRICMCNTFTPDDPLISICAWTGSVQFIHVACLQQWLGTKLSKKETEHCKSYQWKSLKWELCKDTFPSAIQFSGSTKWLIDIPTPETGFLVLETLPEVRTESRSIHAISTQNKAKLNIGRAHESDIRISDISVSRKQAVIICKQNSMFLQDKSSKFGTLVRVKRPIILDGNSSVALQCGRSVFQFELKRPCNIFKCFRFCGSSTIIPDEETVQGDVYPEDSQNISEMHSQDEGSDSWEDDDDPEISGDHDQESHIEVIPDRTESIGSQGELMDIIPIAQGYIDPPVQVMEELEAAESQHSSAFESDVSDM